MAKQDLVVVGNGMVGHRFIELLLESDQRNDWNIVTFCEEPRLAYDRVNLTSFFAGKTASDLSLVTPHRYEDAGVTVHLGDRVTAIDRQHRQVLSAEGRRIPYDALVLATGSAPFVPPIPGRESWGCFVYRTVEDLQRIRLWAKQVQTGVVIGGGLLGLEAAHALTRMGLETHVVEFAPRLMAMQIDDGGAAILRGKIEALGVSVHTSKNTSRIVSRSGRVTEIQFADGGVLATEMVVFSAGISARDELARDCGLAIGERGGIVIDEHCRTTDPEILAIGECAQYRGRTYGLVGPGYQMARTAVATLAGKDDRLGVFDMSTKLKLMGVEVASFGDAHGTQPGARVVAFTDAVSGIYKKLVLSSDRERLLGGVLVGEASGYGHLLSLTQSKAALPPQPEQLILPRIDGGAALPGVEALPDAATICTCQNVAKGVICKAIRCPGPGLGRGDQVRHHRGDRLRIVRAAAGRAAHPGDEARGQEGLQPSLRALPALAPGALPPHPPERDPELRRGRRPSWAGHGVRDLQARRGVHPRLHLERARAPRPAPRAPGHQRPLPGQHPARRELLGGAARAGR